MASTDRVHYYHADACAYGGYFQNPNQQIIVPQAPMSLSPSGGSGSASAANFKLGSLMSYTSASTSVSGQEEDAGYVTTVTSVVEGLNVLGILTADRLSAQMSTVHPLDGDCPTISFEGTEIDNLQVQGNLIDVTLDLDICDQGSGSGFPSGPCVSDSGFLERVAAQYANMNDAAALPAWATSKSIPSWISQRYNAANNEDEYSAVLCSVVASTSGQFPGTPYGNVLDIPNFGRVFLGELLVDCKAYRLTMVRFELKGKTKGNHGGAIGCVNGTTIPPG
jgi:hypothetical protein